MDKDNLKQLQRLVNRLSLENGSDTPDFILAQFLWDSLKAFEAATNSRDVFWGHKHLQTDPSSLVQPVTPSAPTGLDPVPPWRLRVYNQVSQSA